MRWLMGATSKTGEGAPEVRAGCRSGAPRLLSGCAVVCARRVRPRTLEPLPARMRGKSGPGGAGEIPGSFPPTRLRPSRHRRPERFRRVPGRTALRRPRSATVRWGGAGRENTARRQERRGVGRRDGGSARTRAGVAGCARPQQWAPRLPVRCAGERAGQPDGHHLARILVTKRGCRGAPRPADLGDPGHAAAHMTGIPAHVRSTAARHTGADQAVRPAAHPCGTPRAP
jgi:hypothetical protein